MTLAEKRRDWPSSRPARGYRVTRPHHLALAIISLCAALGTAAAHAEMLQFSTPDGIKSWPKLPTITDWHQDQESSLKLAANSLIPDGVDPATAEVAIQARGFSRINNSLAQLLDNDRAAASGAEMKKLPDVTDKDGVPFNLYAFMPSGAGSWKAVAYSEEGETLLAFSLSARSKAAYDRGFPVLVEVIQKYQKDIPW